MRTVAISKPHIFQAFIKGWYCCKKGCAIGFGRNPQEAYNEWLRVNAA